MQKRQIRKYFLIYTALFPVLAFFVYMLFWTNEGGALTLVEYGDGVNQHYRALEYYGEWLRKIVVTLIRKHRFSLPEWNFSAGYGANILTTFHYYVLGDPLTLLSVFVPADFTLYLYEGLIFLRHYLAGLAFSWLCIYLGRGKAQAVLVGAFSYAFSGYMLGFGTQHPFFANAMIYFPLVILGFEKIFRKEKPYILIFAVCISAVSNFYFFYMIALLGAVYVAVCCCVRFGRKRPGEGIAMFFRIGCCALLGVGLAAFLLLPVLIAFISGSRSGAHYVVDLFYDKSYYKWILQSLCGDGQNWKMQRAHIGMGAAALPGTVLLFFGKNRRRYPRELKIAFILCAAFLCFPMAGHIINGFAYVANRWCWAVNLLLAVMIVYTWEDFFTLKIREMICLAAFAALYALAVSGCDGVQTVMFFVVLLLTLMVCGSLMKKPARRRFLQYLAAFAVLAGVVGNAHTYFQMFNSEKLNRFIKRDEFFKNANRSPNKRVTALEKKRKLGFFRYSGSAVRYNSNLLGPNSMQFYWSLSNGNIADFFKDFEVRVLRTQYYYDGLDERTMMSTLAGCAVYACNAKKNEYVPYGYRKVGQKGNYVLYMNDYALPLGYTYSDYITEADLQGLNGVQKEELMMQNVILEEPIPGVSANERQNLSGERIEYEVVSCDGGIEIRDHAFQVSSGDAVITLKINGKEDGETYLCFRGYQYDGIYEDSFLMAEGTDQDGNTCQKLLYYSPAQMARPTRMHEFMMNLGYHEKSVDTVTLHFQMPGLYRWDEMYVWHQPLENYILAVKERSGDAWENESIGTDRVSSEVELQSDKILVLALPYDEGWEAYVDGKKQELLRANVMFQALELEKGRHQIVLVYHTPGLAAGCAISLISACIIIGMFVKRRIVRKKIQYF